MLRKRLGIRSEMRWKREKSGGGQHRRSGGRTRGRRRAHRCVHESEPVQHSLRYGIDRGKHVATAASVCFKAQKRHGAAIKKVFEILDRRGIRQIALLVLKDDRKTLDGAVVKTKICLKALKGLQIVPLAVHLGVDDKDDGISLAQHELQRGIVDHLAGHGVEVKGGFVTRDGIGLYAQEVEEQGTILRVGERHKGAATTRVELGMDLLNVRGLPAQRCAAVNNLEADVAVFVLDDRHGAECEGSVIRATKLPDYEGELVGDEPNLAAQAIARLAIVQHANDDIAREAEGEHAAADVQREGFRIIDADERRETAELPGDIARLLREAGGIRERQIRMTEDSATTQAHAGAKAWQSGEQFDHAKRIQIFLHAEQSTEQELVGSRVERHEAEKGIPVLASIGRRPRSIGRCRRLGRRYRARLQKRGDCFADAWRHRQDGENKLRLGPLCCKSISRREERGLIRRGGFFDLRW